MLRAPGRTLLNIHGACSLYAMLGQGTDISRICAGSLRSPLRREPRAVWPRRNSRVISLATWIEKPRIFLCRVRLIRTDWHSLDLAIRQWSYCGPVALVRRVRCAWLRRCSRHLVRQFGICSVLFFFDDVESEKRCDPDSCNNGIRNGKLKEAKTEIDNDETVSLTAFRLL